MPTTPDSIPQIETPRLRLREFRASDLDAYAAMCADAEVMRHIGAGGPVDRANAWRQMALFNGQWSLEGCGIWAAEREADGVLVGRIGLLKPPDWPALELGWLLGREFWGQGLAREGSVGPWRR
jgi:RimJ/RimL family protein N-acetyltransferase